MEIMKKIDKNILRFFVPKMNNNKTFYLEVEPRGFKSFLKSNDINVFSNLLYVLTQIPFYGIFSIVNELDKRVAVIHSLNIPSYLISLSSKLLYGTLTEDKVFMKDFLNENNLSFKLYFNLHIKSKSIASYYIKYLENNYVKNGYTLYNLSYSKINKNKNLPIFDKYDRVLVTTPDNLFLLRIKNKRNEKIPIGAYKKLAEATDKMEKLANELEKNGEIKEFIDFSEHLIEVYEYLNKGKK
jgi:hypothetical protein